MPLTALGIGVSALALWIVATNLFANPYSPAAQYHGAFLVGGYLYGRRTRSAAGPAYGAALAFGVALAAWALWQLLVGGEHRPHGPLVTPATFGAIMNFLLLPALVLFATGTRRPALAVTLGVLFIGLVASTSRGAWLAFGVAAVGTLLLLSRARLPLARGKVAVLGGLLFLAFAGLWAWKQATLGWSPLSTSSVESRVELWKLALSAVHPGGLLLGAGYDAFFYLMESGRASVPSYDAGTTTYFVHNDYLQFLYAFGVPGLAGLLFIVAWPLIESWRRIPRLLPDDRGLAVAATAAIASMALHAVVDFPFYVPLCVLLYGVALGVLDATLSATAPRAEPEPLASAWRRALKAATLTLVAWVLAVPVAAEAAAAYAQSRLLKLDGEKAAFWLEAARRIDARDWRYHWYAAQFWAAQAAERSDAAAAGLADTALAAAVAANPREVRPLHARIVLHMKLRAVLLKPADGETLRAWADHAVALAPTDRGVQVVRRRVFREFPAP